MEMDKILKYAQKEGYDRIEYLGKWEGYEVYDLIENAENMENEVSFVGYPYVLLVKGNEARISEPMECLRARRELIKFDDDEE